MLLAGCGAGAEPTPTASPDTDAAAAAPTTEPTSAPTASATTEPVTCETLIDSDTLAQLQAQGWTYEESTFTAGGVTVTDGIQCEWGDLESESTASLMLFGWAPLTAVEATQMQDGLVAEGWTLTETASGADISDSFGMTYRFGDGWVLVSDVADQLLLIQRPGA